MSLQNNHKHFYRILLPSLGVFVFICLYLIATLFYPGGNQVYASEKGFSWAQNYWCNLLNDEAINGQPNAAKPIAMVAMFVLCLALAGFWFIFPKYAGLQTRGRVVIQLSGLLSMGTGMFLFTSLHDVIVNIASMFGLVAMAGTFIVLWQLQWKKLFWLGMFNLTLVALNNVLYYGNGLRFYLPVVQKITFLFFLLWVSLMNIQLFKWQVKGAIQIAAK